MAPYIYNTTSGNLGTTNALWDAATSFTDNPQTLTLSASTPGTYFLHVLTVDNAGNRTENVSQAVTVAQLVTGISLNRTTATITEGETLQLTATITPDNASNKAVTWSSSTNAATISTTGLVTAKTAGTTTITVRANDGSNVSATCNVTVESAEMSASDIASNPGAYYGKIVSGYTCTNNSAVANWKIFYAGNDFSADGSYHVYLIADDYIPRANIPNSSAGHALNAGYSSYPRAAYFYNILSDYSGSASITNADIKKLNNDYFTNNYTSSNSNMKSVAYMLDTNAWSVYKGNNADYAVGGPSIEMLMKSYSQAHNVDYRAQDLNSTGYQISNNGGSSWSTSYANMLSTSDSLYVITSTSNAYGYWVSSPSALDSFSVMIVSYNGDVDYNDYNGGNLGFRPLVCLSSDVKFEQLSDGNFQIK